MKGNIATQLNPTQLYLLQLFSFSQTEESQLDLQNVLLSYYKEKVAKRANELWDKLDLDQHKLDEMCSIHERLSLSIKIVLDTNCLLQMKMITNS